MLFLYFLIFFWFLFYFFPCGFYNIFELIELFLNSKKNYLRTFNDTLDNCKSKKQNILDINNSHGKNLIEIFKLLLLLYPFYSL